MAQDFLSIFGPQADPRAAQIAAARAQEMQLAQMNPAQQIAASRAMGAGNAARGMGQLATGAIGAATGVDTRDPQAKLAAVKAKVQAALRGQDLTDPDKVYPVLIRALQEAGLVQEAMAAVREYEDMKLKREDRQIKREDMARKERGAEARLQDARDARAAKDPMRLVKAYGELYDQLESGVLEGDAKLKAQGELKAMAALLKVKPEKDPTGQWSATISQGNATEPARVIKYNKATGEVTVTTLDGKPLADIKAIADAKATPKSDKPLSTKEHGELVDVANQVSALVRLAGAYKPEYQIPPGMARAAAALATVAGRDDGIALLRRLFASNPEAAAWWSAYANLMVEIRHALFGATLTGGEKAAFTQIQALVADQPQAVVNKLKEQATTGWINGYEKANSFSSTSNTGDLLPRFEALKKPVEAMAGSTVGSFSAPSAPNALPRGTQPIAPAPSALPPGVTVKRVS